MYKKSKLMILCILCLSLSCVHEDNNSESIDYRSEMRKFVQKISNYGESYIEGFIVIPQNGLELLTYSGEPDGEIVKTYIDVIDGVGREDLYYGYDKDGVETPDEVNNYMISFLNIAKKEGVQPLITDYCSNFSQMEQSYIKNNQKSYISFSANNRELNNIPTYPLNPYNMNNNNIKSLDVSSNFLYMINPENYPSREAMLEDLKSTNYDILIIDLFDNEGLPLTSDDIRELKQKSSGGSRLVIAYMSIGEAEDYRFYWQEEWNHDSPEWIDSVNPEWEGNYKVEYWNSSWQEIIYGETNSYLDFIIKADFNGVYLDIIDAFEYFE